MKRFYKLVPISGIVALGALAAACSDSTVSPRVRTTPAEGSTRALSRTDTLVFTFTIDPTASATYNIGDGNTLSIPRGTLCDPATSSYGSTEWDKPCPLATQPVTVTFKGWLNRYGHPHIDFSPSLRFETPNNGGGGWVSLTFSDAAAWSDSTTRILYCATATSCVDESKTDFDVQTKKDGSTIVWRKIKHFSGYNVATGEECTPSPDDPDCIDVGDGHSWNPAGGSFTSATRMQGLLRQQPLRGDVSASVTVGVLGGVLDVPGTGLHLVIPPGAVGQQTTITATAVAGRLVAYEFEPHGLVFDVPLVFEQSLTGLVGGNMLRQGRGGYFGNRTDLHDQVGAADVLESLSAWVFGGKLVFPIHHFSGYMAASG